MLALFIVRMHIPRGAFGTRASMAIGARFEAVRTSANSTNRTHADPLPRASPALAALTALAASAPSSISSISRFAAVLTSRRRDDVCHAAAVHGASKHHVRCGSVSKAGAARTKRLEAAPTRRKAPASGGGAKIMARCERQHGQVRMATTHRH